jgi:signal transduction histidine kinase
MGRKGLLLLGAVVFTVLVLNSKLYAWIETESRMLGAAEAEGRALIRAVAAGIESSLEASRAVENLLADRLMRLAPVLERDLAAGPGREREILGAFAASQGLRGALLLDDDFSVRAAAGPTRAAPGRPGDPFSADRIDRLEIEGLARRAREAGLDRNPSVVLGFGENLFRPRTEFLVGRRSETLGGYLLLRQDAQALDTFRDEAGIQRLLTEAGRAEAIDYLVIGGEDGAILAADDPDRVGELMPSREPGTTGARVIDVALPAPWEGPPQGAIHVGLAAGPVESVLQRARLNLAVSTILVLLMGHGALTLVVLRMRRMRRRESRMRRELEARERFAALGRLASGVAHEVRSPLNALSMAAQRLRREAEPAEEPARSKFSELTSALKAGIDRLDGTIEEFLALGRPERPPEIRDIDPESLVDEVIAAEGTSTIAVPPESPASVRADAGLLGKALANLVRNAFQAGPDVAVSIHWRLDGEDCVFEVRDDGPGIAEDERDGLFEPFVTRRTGGTGLGLTIARDAVESQGGRIGVDDSPEGGARFTIRLPCPPGGRE